MRGIYKFNLYYRRFNLLYYRCESYRGRGCKGKHLHNIKTGEEATKTHTLPRNKHTFYQLEPADPNPAVNAPPGNILFIHLVDISLDNENIRKEIAQMIKDNPVHITKSSILSLWISLYQMKNVNICLIKEDLYIRLK